MATHWPVSYSAALTLYCDLNSCIHPDSFNIPADILDIFGCDYLRWLGEVRSHFHDTYFVHELHGWKAATIHNPFDAGERATPLSEFTHDLHVDTLDADNWFVDIALEIGTPKDIFTWHTIGHKSLLQHCLPSQDKDAIDSLINKHAFNQDRMMHLLDLSGFHCKTALQGWKDKVKFIQAYTTEKTMAYQLHQGLFSEKDAQDLLATMKLKKLAKDIKQMSVVLYECTAGENDQHTPQDGCARIEVQVPLSQALTTLTTCSQQLLNNCVVAISSKQWW